MKVHRIQCVQRLYGASEQVWEFISSPVNLRRITPENLDFHIVSDTGEKMYPGLLIEYRLRPLLGLPARWLSEITHVSPPEYFVDEQRAGPFKFWHHKHFLRSVDGLVEMTDIVDYAMPWGLVGDLVHRMAVRGRLLTIFEYRRRKLGEIFPDRSR